MDVISSYRAMAYLKHFPKFGFKPTLLTHHWGEDQNNPSVTIEDHESTGQIIRVPVKKHGNVRFFERLESLPILNKFAILTRWLLGQLDAAPSSQDSYLSLKKYCVNHLKTHGYDLILGIFSPHHHLKLCYELHREFDIPYILDFRDLWHNRIIHKHYQPNTTERIQDTITKHYWKKWLSRALFFSITSEDWKNKLNELTPTEGVVIHNGFDPELFEDLPTVKNSDEFVIIHGGSLYEHQKLNIFLEGCKQFVEVEKPTDFKVKFIGGDRENTLPNQISGFMYQAKERIHAILSTEYCDVTQRIPKTSLAKEIAKCQLLLFPSFPDSPGTYAGKIFDMIASKKNTLMVPDDHSAVGDLIRETNTGFICNSPEEVCNLLTTTYSKWKENGKLNYNGNNEAIGRYSRESQVKKIAKQIIKQTSVI
ncbi:hypothetical protein KO507_08610 [Gilvimarinus agarilyticus]|nr:hypothetical protein [Gilvimarinus agarilyticus]